MIYKTESKELIMRFTIVSVCFDKLIHQLGQYARHLMLNTGKQNMSQLIPQCANAEISIPQSGPDPRLEERGLLRAYLLERMPGLRLLDDMPPETELEFCVVVACQSVHTQCIGFLQNTFGPRDDPESSLVYGQLAIGDVAYELEFRVPHGVHNGQDDGLRLVQVGLS